MGFLYDLVNFPVQVKQRIEIITCIQFVGQIEINVLNIVPEILNFVQNRRLLIDDILIHFIWAQRSYYNERLI